jgi:hypothetical protein
MKGLEGKADTDKDYKITNEELLAYMDLNVSQKALNLADNKVHPLQVIPIKS